MDWTFRPATAADAEWLADLKAVTMRPDLERLGYWDRDWARSRFLDSFVAANTRVVVVDDADVGSIAVRPEPEALWIEHFYLSPSVQGHGFGGQVLDAVLREHADRRPFRLAINRGSRARGLYERRGFAYLRDDENGVDQIFERSTGPVTPV